MEGPAASESAHDLALLLQDWHRGEQPAPDKIIP